MLTSLDANDQPDMGTMSRRDGTGPSWPDSYTGGASALLVYRQGANRGLQGLRFAVACPGTYAAHTLTGSECGRRAERATPTGSGMNWCQMG